MPLSLEAKVSNKLTNFCNMTCLITSKYGCHATDNWRKLREKWLFFRVKILAEECIVNLTCENQFAFTENQGPGFAIGLPNAKHIEWFMKNNKKNPLCYVSVIPRGFHIMGLVEDL